MLPTRISLSFYFSFPFSHVLLHTYLSKWICIENTNAKGKIEIKKKKMSNTFCEFLEFYCIMFYWLSRIYIRREIFEMMGRSFERDNINFIQTQVKNSFSRNLKHIYIEKYLLCCSKTIKFFTIKNIAIWISSLSTNPPRKFEEDTFLLYNKLGIDTLRNHFHISSYRSLFYRLYFSDVE